MVVQPRFKPRGKKGFWLEVKLTNIVITMVALFIYAALFETVGFIIMTVLLLSFFFHIYDPRPWWKILIASILITLVFYLVFKFLLGTQLPTGYLGITA